MQVFRQYRWIWAFLGLLVFCSVMVIRQINAQQSRHVEIREAFILLYTKGYTNQANRLYQHLLMDIHRLPNKTLTDDFQRTLLLIDPSAQLPENLIWKFHWTISNEMERRSESTLMRALKLADQVN